MAGIQIIGQFVLPSWSIYPHPTPIKNVDKPYPIPQYRKLIMSDVISSKNAALLSFYKTTLLYLFGCVLLTRSEPISEVWGSQPVNRHYFQNISLVKKRWKLFSHQRGSLCVVAASPAKSDFMLLWDIYCRAELQSHQIIISPIPLIHDFIYTYFAQKILWTVNACLHSMFYTRSAKRVTIYACVGVHRKARELF